MDLGLKGKRGLVTGSEGVGAFVAQMAEARGVDAATVERELFATDRPSSWLQRFATP
jgi:NADPH:quinone reductase-like Zn-dependent oxidoreductase